MATTETKVRYSIFPEGSFMEISGRLGADLVISKTKNDKRYCVLSIAVNAGSKKDENGEYINITDWYKITVWDNGGNSTVFLNHLETASEKVKFYKGNKVILRAMITKKVEIHEGKAYCNYTATNFFHLGKEMSDKSTSEKVENTTSNDFENKSSEVDDF